MNSLKKDQFKLSCHSLFGMPAFMPNGSIMHCFSAIPKWNPDNNEDKLLTISSNNIDYILNNPITIKLRRQILEYKGQYKWICPLNSNCKCNSTFNNYDKHYSKFQEFKFNKNHIINNTDIQFIVIDFSTYCQLKCLACWQGGQDKQVNSNTLKFAHLEPNTFNNILKQLPNLLKINIANYGEPFINPNFCKLIDIINSYNNIKNICIFSTNFNYITDTQIYSILHSNFSEIIISIDGVTPKTYSKYRIGGNFDKVIENIKRFNYFKELYNNTKVILSWQYILFDFNLHEVEKAAQMAEDLGMKFYIRENHTKSFYLLDKSEYIESKQDIIIKYLNQYQIYS